MFKRKISYTQRLKQLKAVPTKKRRYEWFCEYIQLIVYFKATGAKRHKYGTIKSRCEIDFTTRQLAKYVGRSHVTIASYLKRMLQENLIGFSRLKKNKEARLNDMKFYYIKSVYKKITAAAKKKTYRFIRKMSERPSKKTGETKLNTSKNLLRSIQEWGIKTKKKYRLRTINSLDLKSIHFRTQAHGIVSFENYDLRRKDLARPKVSDDGLRTGCLEMLAILEAAENTQKSKVGMWCTKKML